MSSSNPTKKYDVFLSFRGEDVRNNFTGHLYAVLEQKGIYTFKDDVLLERGRDISPTLLKAIEDSKCAVIVLSKNYASSAWCLAELAKIVECLGTSGRILPIFYHVDKDQVEKQSGSYEEAFKTHEADSRHKHNVKSWKDALTTVANLNGWHVEENKTDEAEFIQNFVLGISKKICNPEVHTSEGISGVHSRLDEFQLCVSQSLGKVRFIGICGMGGIGKTTLVKAYYKQKSEEFKGNCSFIEDVREVCKQENGLVELQNILLSDILKGSTKEIRVAQSGKAMIRNRLCHKKVLIVLDDVDKLEQLKALAGKEDWFGSGSIIIVTTRDESLIKKAYGNQTPIYRVGLLNEGEAVELFSWKAFKSTHPSEDYSELCSQVLRYANGLPLALEVLGSDLEGLQVNEWESALSRLNEYPNMKILDVLQVSFDGLEEPEKDIFLDIACFFVGLDKDYVIEMLNCSGRHTDYGIRVLVYKSLLIIDDDNRICMHGLLQQMGKQIVRKQSPKEPGSRSRLWDINDFYHILEENTGTEKVEAIVTVGEGGKTFYFDTLSKMNKLRLLQIRFSSFCSVATTNSVLRHLSNDLGFLEWNYFPYVAFPSSFQPHKLVTLKLIESNIERICWHKIPTQLASWKLKNIDLSYSRGFHEFEDFSVVPNLEQLILEGCTNLSWIHPSIATLKWLIILNLKDCRSLESLPPKINGLESLRILNLYGCSRILELPEDVVELKSLEDVDVRKSGIKHVPSFVVPIKNLKTSTLDDEMEDLYRMVGKDLLSAGISHLHLTTLDLSGRDLSDETVPKCLNHLVSLEYLNLSRNSFTLLPISINELSKLQVLVLEHCEFLTCVGPQLPSSLQVINVNHCTSLNSFFDPSEPSYFCCCVALCLECHRLVHKQQSIWRTFTFLKRYLKYSPAPTRSLDIVLPSFHIPSWFTNISSGPSTSIQVHPNWCNSSFKGWAVCALFDATPSDQLYCDITFSNLNDATTSTLQLVCPASGRSSSRHLWVFYTPRHGLPTKWQQENSHGLFHFSFHWGTTLRGHSRCGPHGVCVRLVYEKDIKELDQITTKDQIRAKDVNNKDYIDVMSLNRGFKRPARKNLNK